MISRLQVALTAAALALLLPAALCGWVLLEMGRPWSAWDGESVEIVLEPGMSARAMLVELHEHGVIRYPKLVRRWLAMSGGSDTLQAGEYRFDEPISPREVMDRLRSGDVILYGVTVPEGLWLEDVARQISEAGFSSHDALVAAFRDPTPILALDPAAEDLEGYLFPDTYSLPRGADADAIVEAMVARFTSVADAAYLDAAEEVGLSLREAVTLASLIERETSVAGERARISRVFHNRLEQGMRLQCDPTVIYALHRAGRRVKRLYTKHLEVESPWNTYRVRGLPVGPIANPGQASLHAAVRPADGPELYFVAAPGGGHQFSNSLREHQRAVAVWRAYVRSSR